MSPRLDKLAWVLATWFGCGRSPVAPGTAGTLGAVPLYLVAARGGAGAVAAAAVVATGVGVWASSRVARESRLKDPQFVVIDEVAGFLVTMIPAGRISFVSIAAGVLLFRLLDATKPGPIRRIEHLHGGWGIVLDDVAAGAVAAAGMALLRVLGALP